MAQTYTLAATGITLAANKVILGAFNGAGSGRILRIYRVWVLNNQVAAVTGVVNTVQFLRTTTGSGGTAITPLKHDSSSENFPAQIVVSSNQSSTQTDLIARLFWSSDEPAAGTLTNDELQTMPAMNLIFDVGYNDSNIEPIVCREGFGVALVNITSTVGVVDVFMEVTLAST